MKITYYGHSSIGVEIAGKHLLFDPFISPNELAGSIDINQVPADFILVSHGHADHVADVEAIAKNTGAQLISTFEVVNWFEPKGVEGGLGMNIGGEVKLTNDITVKMVVAIHSSSMPDGTYGGNPAGFVVITPEESFYFAGDTALTVDMEMISEYADLDCSFLPIGNVFTMGVSDAIQAAGWVESEKVVGIHYDTFPPIKIDRAAAVKEFSEAGIELLLPEIGTTIEI